MLGDQLLMSLQVIILGMGTVFLALVALIFVIELINKLITLDISPGGKKEKTNEIRTEESIKGETLSEEKNEDSPIVEEEEIIAVISAAIAASLNRSTHDILVKSIRRVPYNTPVWNRVSRSEQISGRF